MRGDCLAVILWSGLCVAAALLVMPNAAHAQSCRPGDIEVGRDAHNIYCKSRVEYAACIGRAGEAMRQELRGRCGAAYKNCFEGSNVGISLTAAGCLAMSLTAAPAGRAARAAVCNVLFTAYEWNLYHSCTVQVTPCYEDALTHDRQRKAVCAQP
jgi:hypothetical protein